ncbi:hypothetical protein GWK47_036426 [Chionoecetes opilio]|uniref:Uncharacterized protein n=1 Tax=Chionoecetes opilio TaxID=41210 RepID=A0A8J5CZP7_CHIOP|nr:hypothetical protein GWK47_036426 [Chionoecetes opilio]
MTVPETKDHHRIAVKKLAHTDQGEEKNSTQSSLQTAVNPVFSRASVREKQGISAGYLPNSCLPNTTLPLFVLARTRIEFPGGVVRLLSAGHFAGDSLGRSAWAARALHGSKRGRRESVVPRGEDGVLAVIDSGLGWSATGKKFGLHEATVRTTGRPCGYQSKWTSGEENVYGVANQGKRRGASTNHLSREGALDPPLPPGYCQPWDNSLQTHGHGCVIKTFKCNYQEGCVQRSNQEDGRRQHE